MICLYAADESLFEHNGLGILDNDLKKCHVEEVLNNLYTLTAQYPLWAKFGKSIRNGMIIKAPTPNGYQLFRIYQSKPSMGMLEIHAFHIFYDLAFNFVEDTNIVSKSGQAWLQQLSQNTQYSHPFTFISDISTVAGSRVVRKNCVEILLNTSLDNSFVNRFGGEILRDNFNVYFNRSIGENRGFKIRHKKNLKGYTANIDDKSVITRIMPIGFDGLLLPEKYVDSPRISDYPFPRIGKVEVDVKAAVGENTDAKDAIPLNEAYTKMRDLIKEQFGIIDVPTCSYEVDFVELSKTKEYADFQNLETVRIGDTVTVSHDEDGFYVEAKVIRYEYDSLAGRLLRIEAGQFESRSSNNSINQQRSIEQQLEDVKTETSNMVQVAANGKNTIYRGLDRPTNANVGDLWYEPLENSVVLKQWSGVDWELIPISDQNLGNVNVNNLSGNYIDVRRFRISSGDRDILYVNEAGEVILNAKRIQIDFTDVATKTDLQEIELTPGPQGPPGRDGVDGIAGRDGVGIVSTDITYYLSTSGITTPTTGWSSSVPTLIKGRYLWTKTVWTYSDGQRETGYQVTYIAQDGNSGVDGLPGKDGVGITSTTITYARSTSGTSAPTSGWTSAVPSVPPGEFLWTKTVWNYSDNTTETGYSVGKMGETGPKGDKGADGLPGKDGIGIKSTAITYGLSTSDSVQPINWTTTVPNLVKGQYLWTKTVWSYDDSTSETGYTKTYIAKDGNSGTDGLPGKDGVGIKTTTITYAKSTNGTTAPTSGWSTTVPSVPNGQYLWTRTTWTYDDNTTETGYSVAKMGDTGPQGPKGDRGSDGIAGKDGVGIKSTEVSYVGSSNGTTQPTSGWSSSVPSVAPGNYLWTRTVWTYTDLTQETGYTVSRIGKDGNTGKDGIAGKDGVGIKTTTITYAKSTNGMTAPTSGWGKDVPSANPGEYIWTKTVWEYTDSTTETGYSVGKIGNTGPKGDKGDTGPQGVQGPKGADGKPTYTWIRYADSITGTGISNDPTGKPYIGLAYNKPTATESNTPSDYTWSLIQGPKGNTGERGPKGTDGQTTYTWIKYSANADGTGLTDTPQANTAYVGIATNKTTATESTVKTDYVWSLFKGPKGDRGADGIAGKDGKGITGTVITYGLSTSETIQPSTWTSTVPTLVKGQYLWTKTVWTYSDSTNETGYTKTYIAKDGNNGTNGIAGKDGVGIKSTSITYASSPSGTSTPTSGWSTSVPNVSPGHFLWTKTIWSYTDNTSETGYSVGKIGNTGPKGDKGDPGIQGIQGPKGDQGIQGVKGADGKTQYTHIAYADNSTGGGFSQTDQTKAYIGMYQDFTATDSTNPASYKWTKWKGTDGAQGIPGQKGADGRTPYIHFAYANNADGTGLTLTDNGQRYMGHYSDYTQADSTDKTKYRWADRWAKIDIGTDNLLVNTASLENNIQKSIVNTLDKYNGGTIAKGVAPGGSYRDIFQQTMKTAPIGNVFIGSFYAKSTLDGHRINCYFFSPNRTIQAMSSDGYTWSNATGGDGRTSISLSTEWKRYWVVWTIRDATLEAENVPMTVIFCRNNDSVNEVSLALPALYVGNINKEHSLAQEDIQANIDTKADQALTEQQLNLLTEKAQQMQTELDAKVTMESLSDLERAYNAYVEATGKAIAKSENDLIEAARRVDAIVETLGGLKKTKTFIDTYITEANEGIVIGTNDNVSQIRVTHDRIAMYSAGKEVMYISQGVIHIDNGVFTKSLQIGRFVTSQHESNPDINICRYVG